MLISLAVTGWDMKYKILLLKVQLQGAYVTSRADSDVVSSRAALNGGEGSLIVGGAADT